MNLNKIKVYHLSPNKNRESILLDGIKLGSYNGKYLNFDSCIFVSNSKKIVAFDFVDYEEVDLWEFEIETEKLVIDTNTSEKGYFFIKEAIESSRLKLIKCY